VVDKYKLVDVGDGVDAETVMTLLKLRDDYENAIKVVETKVMSLGSWGQQLEYGKWGSESDCFTVVGFEKVRCYKSDNV